MNNNQQKLLNILSMAARANKIVSGDFAITNAVNNKNVNLILIAEDISEKTKHDYDEIACKSDIPLMSSELSKETLGSCIGKNERAAAAVCDKGFANAISKILK